MWGRALKARTGCCLPPLRKELEALLLSSGPLAGGGGRHWSGVGTHSPRRQPSRSPEGQEVGEAGWALLGVTSKTTLNTHQNTSLQAPRELQRRPAWQRALCLRAAARRVLALCLLPLTASVPEGAPTLLSLPSGPHSLLSPAEGLGPAGRGL